MMGFVSGFPSTIFSSSLLLLVEPLRLMSQEMAGVCTGRMFNTPSNPRFRTEPTFRKTPVGNPVVVGVVTEMMASLVFL